jgi:hypothetical protein
VKLYFLAGHKDIAATSAADLAALVTALADPYTETNANTISRVTGKVETLVQSDSGEPLELYFYEDDGSTVQSWVTDSSATLACGLGLQDPRTADTYASTTAFSISGSSRRGTLALNTTNLRDALEQYGKCVPGFGYSPARPATSARFFLHLRKTVAGVKETLALLPVAIAAGVLSDTPEDISATTYLTTADARAGYVLNVSGISSLTGGGATALDGLDAGSASYPVGCLIATTEAVVGGPDYLRHWRLKGTYIAASDVDNGQVKPTNSDATLNPVHWKQCG